MSVKAYRATIWVSPLFLVAFQMAMIIVLIAAFEGSVFEVVEQILIWVSLILTIVSLVDYIRKNKEVLTQGGM